MLVLSRKTDQALILTLPDGRVVRVVVVEVRGAKVRVGVEADPDVKVMREEICSAGS